MKSFWSATILQGYLTTIFGILAGGPVLVTQSCAALGLTLPSAWTHGLLIIGATGLIGLGIVAKAFNTHSSPAQVLAKGETISASQATALGIPNATALVEAAKVEVKAANVEAAGK
jgi:hypothetical protein